MSTPLLALLGMALWALLLVTGIGSIRVVQVLQGKVPPKGFNSGQQHGSEAYWRLNRAHLNCVENLPVLGALVLVTEVAELGSAQVDGLAMTYLVARVGQTVAHVSSGSNMAVNVRFTFFVVQLVVAVAWAVTLLA